MSESLLYKHKTEVRWLKKEDSIEEQSEKS